MEIFELIKRKKQLEGDLSVLVGRKIQSFIDDTGVSIQELIGTFVEAREIQDMAPRYIFTGINIEIALT